MSNELIAFPVKSYQLLWECRAHGVAYYDNDRERMGRLIEGHLMMEHGVPAETFKGLQSLFYENLVVAYGEREALLCEAMFWLQDGSRMPSGIGNLDAFLLDLVARAQNLWQNYDWMCQRVKTLMAEKAEYERVLTQKWEGE